MGPIYLQWLVSLEERRIFETEAWGESHVKTEAESYASLRALWYHQKSGEGYGMHCPSEPAEGANPAWFQTSGLDFSELWENKFLLSHPACGDLLWQPWKTSIYHLSTILFILYRKYNSKKPITYNLTDKVLLLSAQIDIL